MLALNLHIKNKHNGGTKRERDDMVVTFMIYREKSYGQNEKEAKFLRLAFNCLKTTFKRSNYRDESQNTPKKIKLRKAPDINPISSSPIMLRKLLKG